MVFPVIIVPQMEPIEHPEDMLSITSLINFGFLYGRLSLQLASKTNKTVSHFVAMRKNILEALSDLELKSEAKAFQESTKVLDDVKREATDLTPDELKTIDKFSSELSDSLLKLFKRKYAIVIDSPSASKPLRNLKEKIVDEEQKTILADAIRCVDAGAYYAAIVMTWNLTYDYIRRWIFVSKRSRLKRFNSVLNTYNFNGQPRPAIKDYDDFFTLGEALVLEVAFKAKLFNKNMSQLLTHALTQRNHFAHPSHRKTNQATTMGYIENLIVNVVTNSHFEY
jgi:hypothetical protein